VTAEFWCNKEGCPAKSSAEVVTYLPLAIVQAAAYINENGITIAEYLFLLKEQEEEVIDLLRVLLSAVTTTPLS
jgi:hypothetical protein